MELLVELSHAARAWWGAWLMLLFLGIVAWAMWPSRRRSQEMHDASMIPFRENDDQANLEPR